MRQMSEEDVWLSETKRYRPSRRLIFISLLASTGLLSGFALWFGHSQNGDKIVKNEVRETPIVFKNPKSPTAKKMKNIFEMLKDESVIGGKLR